MEGIITVLEAIRENWIVSTLLTANGVLGIGVIAAVRGARRWYARTADLELTKAELIEKLDGLSDNLKQTTGELSKSVRSQETLLFELGFYRRLMDGDAASKHNLMHETAEVAPGVEAIRAHHLSDEPYGGSSRIYDFLGRLEAHLAFELSAFPQYTCARKRVADDAAPLILAPCLEHLKGKALAWPEHIENKLYWVAHFRIFEAANSTADTYSSLKLIAQMMVFRKYAAGRVSAETMREVNAGYDHVSESLLAMSDDDLFSSALNILLAFNIVGLRSDPVGRIFEACKKDATACKWLQTILAQMNGVLPPHQTAS